MSLDIYLHNKRRYIKLIGGTLTSSIEKKTREPETKNIMLVTHNARLRCLLEDIKGDLMESYRKRNNVKEIRFKNTCMLKISLMAKNHKGFIELAYEGSVNTRKSGAYFISPLSMSAKSVDNKIERELKDVELKNVEFLPVEFDLKTLGVNTGNIEHNYNIFLIRHGEATHNVTKLNIKFDTNLTNNHDYSGVKQAENAGNVLLQILNKIDANKKIDVVLCSYLQRTMQTSAIIMKILGDDRVLLKDIRVLPCAHELKYSDGGKCDNKIQILAPENRTWCTLKDNKNYKCVDKVIGYNINWDYYHKFKSDKGDCSKTNMIKFLLENNDKEKSIIESADKYPLLKNV